MTRELFRSQLASYAAVHRDRRNKATHFVGIPVIVFSLLLLLTLWHAALPVAILTVAGWLALDLGIGLVMAVLMAAAWTGAELLSTRLGTPPAVWTAFTALFVGGWILQFLGHHYEGKRPALIDNVFQAFIGPMFLVAEALVALGRRPDLARAMEQDRVTAR